MNNKSFYRIMLGLSALSILGVLFALYISLNILNKQSDNLVNVKLDSKILDDQQISLAKAKKSIEKYSELNSIAKSVVPQDKDQARSVRDLSAIASELDIQLSSITFPASTLGQTSTTKNAKSETQVTPVKGIPKVFELQITVQQNKDAPITYERFLLFLEKLEKNRRTAQVNNISITPDSKNRNLLSFNLVLNTYIKP